MLKYIRPKYVFFFLSDHPRAFIPTQEVVLNPCFETTYILYFRAWRVCQFPEMPLNVVYHLKLAMFTAFSSNIWSVGRQETSIVLA